MSSANTGSGLTDEQVSKIAAGLDEIEGFRAITRQPYYVLAELEAGRENRVVLKDLRQQLPVDELCRTNPDYNPEHGVYVEGEGEYFPDLIEENGIYLVSLPLYEEMNNILRMRQCKRNHVGVTAENRERMEEYCLIVPPQVDAILEGSARYDRERRLTYFEIDESKIGKQEIFRIKGFPHLIVTQKINRLAGAGYQCTRIENFFDYAGTREQLYQERQSVKRLEEVQREYEKRVKALDKITYHYGLVRMLDQKQLCKELKLGIQAVLDSYSGSGISTESGSAQCFSLYWPKGQGRIDLVENTGFTVDTFAAPTLARVCAYIDTIPDVLRSTAVQVCFEALLLCLIQELWTVDTRSALHGDRRLRICLESDLVPTTNPAMIYEYKPQLQREAEAAVGLSKLDLNGKELQGFDFRHKNCSGLKLTGCNLSLARFDGALLEKAEFVGCDLTGASFKGCNLKEAMFTKCELNRTVFDGAMMPGAVLTGSNLFHCSFIKTDLTGGRIQNLKLFQAYFYKTKLAGTEFKVKMTICNCQFRLCDLRKAQFSGDAKRSVNQMSGCDFRNSDLTEARVTLHRIAKTNFGKAKLIGADFTGCNIIQECNFRWSGCAGLNLNGLMIEKSNFIKVDLTFLKPKSGAVFNENNFSHANLSGYDFTVAGYPFANDLTCANLNCCNLEEADLSTSKLINTEVEGANLNQAILSEEQLPWVKLSAKQRSEIVLAGTNEDEEDEADDDTEDEDGSDEMDSEAEVAAAGDNGNEFGGEEIDG
ncbi:MAG TPA: pentapeptide repeat-containing protein [Bacillota bacterium]|nr:pentapeptide repeat-containing protein [Bacillota bacterium]